MANKLLLKESIDKLKRNNEIILGRLRRMCDLYNTKDKQKIEELLDKAASIDIIIQGSLISYYFMNNHNFILENIIKFIPIFLFIIIIGNLLILFVFSAIRYANENNDFETLLNSNKDECKKALLEIGLDKNKYRRFYDKVTDISLSILLILTGHCFCFIMFIVNKIIFTLSKNIAKQTLKEMEN